MVIAEGCFEIIIRTTRPGPKPQQWLLIGEQSLPSPNMALWLED